MHAVGSSASIRDSRRIDGAHAGRVWSLIGGFALLYVGISAVLNETVLTTDLVADSWFGLAVGDRDLFAERQARWRLYGYVLTPFFIVARITYSAICLSLGCILREWDVPFARLFRACVYGEIVWLVAAFIHLFYVLTVVDISSMLDYSNFYPLSVLSVVDVGSDELWSVYFLKTLNVFEVFYAAVLALAIRPHIRRPWDHLLSLVAIWYGGGLFLLMTTITFLFLSLIP